MVRFQAFDDASDDADLRAKRGAHLVVFEDGDAGPALRAATPFLKWSDVEASPALPFAEFVDFTLRVMKMPPGTLDSAKTFALNQITAGPLNRCWQMAAARTDSAHAAAQFHRRRRQARASSGDRTTAGRAAARNATAPRAGPPTDPRGGAPLREGVWLTAGSRGSRQLRNDTAVMT